MQVPNRYQNLPDEPFLAVLYPPNKTSRARTTITTVKSGDSSSLSAMFENVLVNTSEESESLSTGLFTGSIVILNLAGPGGQSS